MNKVTFRKKLSASIMHHLDGAIYKIGSGFDHVRFERKTPSGKSVIYVSITRRGDAYWVSLYLTLFQAQVECVHCLALGLPRTSYNIRGTLIGGVDYKRAPTLQYHSLTTEAEIELWCAEASHYIKNYGNIWFQQAETLDALNTLFNSAPENPVDGMAYLLSRAEKGIIIAKLNNNPKLKQLIESYRILLKEGDILLTFEEVVNFLTRHSVEELQSYTLKDLKPL
jgi:hypothetical protein